jgi:hypothetical protein|nr:MAG TPA: integrase [Caudoviricetes sp.]
MAHIPLGYKIVDGCAVVDEPTVKQIKETYRYYFEGKSLVDAAEKAGFKMNHSTVKRMLSNKKYLGTDYYPQIIDEETIERFQEELTRRAGNLGRLDRKSKDRNKTIPTSFYFKPADLTFPDPFEQAEYIYSLIESEE